MIILIIAMLYTIPLLISAVSKKISYAAGMVAAGVTIALAIVSLTHSPINETVALGSSVFGVDSLSWYFLLVGSVSWILTSLYSISYDDYSRVVTASYHAAILSIVLLIFSRSYLPFLFAWEGMSISGYFLISYKRNTDSVPDVFSM